MKEQTGAFRPKAQCSNKENWRQGQNYGNYNRKGHYVRYGNYNCDNSLIWGNYGNRNDPSGAYFPPQNWEVAPRDGGGNVA